MSVFGFSSSWNADGTDGTINPLLLQNPAEISTYSLDSTSLPTTENEASRLSPFGGSDEDSLESVQIQIRRMPPGSVSVRGQHPVQSAQDTEPQDQTYNKDDAATDVLASIADGTLAHSNIGPIEHQTPSPRFLGECGLQFDSQYALDKHIRSPHARDHCIVNRRQFICRCGQNFAKLFTLERHIKNFQKCKPEYPCDECDTYRGSKAFSRKDHLVQHLREFHKYDAAQLEARFPHDESMVRVWAVSVCHIKSCEHYRGDDFQELEYQEREQNRPFARQSDYTAHMKKEHDWSPHPCDFPGCKKVKGKGFFSFTALVKHRDEQHPGMKPLESTPVIKSKRTKYYRGPEFLRDDHVR
ncbi:hypothetical protein F4810DRAFT_719465 [Camillea tinctor]|nr:hypothetical protein F4810DRAFT_719465 [Camillea tinctor]